MTIDIDLVPAGAGRPLRVALLPAAGGIGVALADALTAHAAAGLELDVLPAAIASELLTSRAYDLIHTCAGEPPATATPYVAAYDPVAPMELYRGASAVLSPGHAADLELLTQGISAAAIHRWNPGVDPSQFHPSRYAPDALGNEPQLTPGRINLLHVGALTDPDALQLLASAFQLAYDRDCRLHLTVIGEGPGQQWLRGSLGSATTLLGMLEGERLAAAYATADLLIHTSGGDPFGGVIIEAQASGLPVLAVESQAATELIESGRSGCLVAANTLALGEAVRWLARRGTLRERLTTGGLQAIRSRTWERSLGQLTAAWETALAPTAGEVARAA
jgi:glycosyltransferase involved in cell wall biosynthesis